MADSITTGPYRVVGPAVEITPQHTVIHHEDGKEQVLHPISIKVKIEAEFETGLKVNETIEIDELVEKFLRYRRFFEINNGIVMP